MLAQQVIVGGQLLELAVAAAGALGALGVVLAQQQTQIHAAGFTDAGRVGVDHHALGHHVVAGGHEADMTLDLHHAEAAGGDLVNILEIAQGGDIDMYRLSGLQNGGTFRYGDNLIVDLQRYHSFTLPPLKIP